MPKKLLSLVIPTYNMEQYLPQCLDSITRSDVPNTLEVIVVNDGSKDKSLEIAKKYQSKRPDIISIIDKPNGHYGSCINAALNVATGKYFRPLDADDWFDTDALLSILEKLDSIDADLLITPRTEHKHSTTRIYSLNTTPFQIQPIENFQKIAYDNADGILSMHSMTYNRALLKKIQLKLTEGICYTDTEYYILPFLHCKNFIYLEKNLYQYRLDREGQSMDPNIFFKNRHQLAVVINNILQKIEISPSTHIFEKIKNILIPYFSYTLFQCKQNKVDKKDMQNLRHSVQSCCPFLWKVINKKLRFAPTFWEIFGINFHLYTKVKGVLGIKDLFPTK